MMEGHGSLRIGFVHPDLGIGQSILTMSTRHYPAAHSIRLFGVCVCVSGHRQAEQKNSSWMQQSLSRTEDIKSFFSPLDMTPKDVSKRLAMVSGIAGECD